MAAKKGKGPDRDIRGVNAKEIKKAQAAARELRKDLEAMKASGTATTAELKKQTIELRKSQTIVSDLQKKRKAETKDTKETNDLISETEKLQTKIAEKIADMSDGSKDFLNNQVGIEDITDTIADNHKRAQNYAERGTVKAKATAGVYTEIGNNIGGALEGLIATEAAAENVGTAGFNAGTAELAVRKQQAEALRRDFQTKLDAGELDDRSLDRQLRQLDTLDALVKTDEKRIGLLEEIDSTAKAAATSITAPLEKVSGFVKSMPFGPLIAHTMQLDDKMSAFGETVSGELGKAMDPKSAMTYDDALSNISSSGKELVSGLASGLKQVASMLMANPMMLMVVAIVAAGMALKKLFGGFTELRKEMGLTFGAAAKLQENINVTAARFSMMGVSAEDVKGVVTGIQNEWGGVGSATEENIGLLTDLNARFGISGEHGAALTTQMMAVGAHSREAAAAQLASVGSLARASGVAPAAIMADIAENTEAFAGFAKDGGMNVMKAAISARKLGLNMGTVSKIADSLLDFESSIEAQMEASMLTGRAINTDKARELALSGDLVGMQKEVTKQIGTQADWEAMNIVQRKALAKAFGMEVSEVGKMMAEQARRANMTQAEIAAEEAALKEKAEKEERNQKMISDVMMFIGDLWASILKAAKLVLPVIVGIGIALAIAFFPITLAVAAVVIIIKVFQKLAEFIPGIQYALGAIVTLLALKYMWTNKIGFLNGDALKNMWQQIKTGAKQIKDLVSRLFGEKQITKEKEKQASADDGSLDKGKKAVQQAKDKLKSMLGLDKGGDKGGIEKADKTKAAKKPKGGIEKADKTKAAKKPKPGKKGGKKGGKGGMGFMEKIDGKKMIQGAAALLIAAAAMWVAAKALQEFAKVTWTAIAMAGVTLLGLTVVLAILGQLKGQLIQGAVAMLIMSVALIPFAFALQMFTGIDFAQVALGGVAMIGFALAMGLLGLAAPYIIVGAIAMAIMGVALIPFAVALRLFTGIDFAQVALGGVAMLGLGLALGALGFMAPLIIMGAWALGIMSAALLVFGIALIAVGTGMTMIKNAFSGITEQITQLATMANPILLLARSFTVLGVSMGAMALGALMLLPALPVLFALNKMGLLGGVSLGGGGEEAEAGGGEANPVELKLDSTNAKLDTLIGLMSEDGFMVENLKGIKKNTGTFADGII